MRRAKVSLDWILCVFWFVGRFVGFMGFVLKAHPTTVAPKARVSMHATKLINFLGTEFRP